MFKEKLRAFQEKQLNAHLMLGGYYPDATKSVAQQSAQEPQKTLPKEKSNPNFNSSITFAGSS